MDSTALGDKLAAVVPELGEFYTPSQMQNLGTGDTIVQTQPDGSFTLELFLQDTSDLQNWQPLPVALDDLSISNGKIHVRIQPSVEDTKFYRLGTIPGE